MPLKVGVSTERGWEGARRLSITTSGHMTPSKFWKSDYSDIQRITLLPGSLAL
jgi:hypothetical protein